MPFYNLKFGPKVSILFSILGFDEELSYPNKIAYFSEFFYFELNEAIH